MLTPDELLTTTRSVRRRLDIDRPVDIELVKDCLSIALQAPNGSNAQRWRWIVITDPELRAGIAEYYLRAWRNHSHSARGGLVDTSDYLTENLASVPVLVIPCLELAGPELPTGNQARMWGSLLPAVWSYMLAARARGLGTTWTALHLDYEAEVAALLGLPPHIRQGALIPTAHTIGTRFHSGPRIPLEDVLHVDGWCHRPIT